MEAVEIGGIAFIVSGVLMGLFFALAAGMTPPSGTDDADTAADTGADTASESLDDVAGDDAETAGNDDQAGENE
jgi:hypothetical protein